jgi:type IX secretion system PorP/SprF family membrane protein
MVLIGQLSAQQVTDHLQYPFAPVLVNPAFCGAEGAMTAGLQHRQQWTSMDGAPEGNTAFLHTPLRNKAFNLGMLIEQQKFGVFQRGRYSALYAYRARLGEARLCFGLSAGYETFLNDWNSIITTTGTDPRFTGGATRVASPHVAAGALFTMKGFAAGFAFPQLYGNNYFYRMYVATAEYSHALSSSFALRPIVMYRTVPAATDLVSVTLCASYMDAITIGVTGASNQSLGALLNIRCTPQMQFGYGYSRLTSKLDTYAGATHELTLRYLLRFKVNSISSR